MRILKACLLILLLATAARLATESGSAVHLDECHDACAAQYSSCLTDAGNQYNTCAENADSALNDCQSNAEHDYEDCVRMFGMVNPCENGRDYAEAQFWDHYSTAMYSCGNAEDLADGYCAQTEQDCESHCP